MLSEIVMKEKLLVIIRPNKIGGAQLENVFLFVQIYWAQLENVFLFVQIYWIYTFTLNIPNDSKTFMGKTIHTLGQTSSKSGTSATCGTSHHSLWHLKGVQKPRK